MIKIKFKEMYEKFGKYVFVAIITGLLFFANIWNPCWIIAACLLIPFYCTCSVSELFCYTMYFEFFSSMDLFFVANLVVAFVVIVIRYIIDVCKKRKKIFVWPLALTTLIVVLFSIIHYSVDYNGLTKGALVIALLYVCYFVFVYHKEIDIDACFKYLSIGMLVSIVLGFASLLIPNANYPIFYSDDAAYKRLQLFAFHVNFLSMLCIFNISYMVYKIVNKKGNLILSIIIAVISSVLGVLTLSKTFILIFAIIMAYLVLFLVLRYKWKSLRFILPMIVMIVVFGFIFKDFVADIFARFFAYNTSSSILDRLLTGRIGIWKMYIEETTSSILKMLFGVGLFSVEIWGAGPHSVPVFLLHRMGFVGIILIGLLIYSYAKCSNSKLKLTFKNCLPLLMWVFIALEEMIFSERFVYFLLFALVILVENNQNEIQNKADVDVSKN